ncbi:MAG: hypothetical protein ABIS50_21665 [Luteolibacter sp.]|uniref:type II secretion system protein n=1 Tax=Luteolibacter sp. TaxID=1962973 RepID=UPI0032638C81
MRNHRTPHCRKTAAGFTLPSILVVVAALLILAVGILLVVGIERNTARSFVDRQRAALAARAGLEDVKGILNLDAANDEYVVLQSTLPPASTSTTSTAPLSPQLFLARAKASEGKYHYTPLFSTLANTTVDTTKVLSLPEVAPLVGKAGNAAFNEFQTLPYQAKSTAAWRPVLDSKGKMVGRYSYWVEDLQSRLDARTAGNIEDGGKHKRYGWKTGDSSKYAKFPAPGLNPEPSDLDDSGRDKKPPLNQVALYSLDPASTAQDSSTLDNTIISGRKALVSPDSTLAVAGIVPPLVRDATGSLTDAKAKAVEEGLTASVQPYDEQPVVPFAPGINTSVVGKPKLNLNAIIAKSPDAAVDEMASWIKTALPTFDDRKGGFPEDYVKTIAASAVGYAASGNKPVVQMGSYRGLGASPMFSEILMNINYIKRETIGRSDYLHFEFELFAELFNHTNLPITAGKCQLSYEVGLNLPRIGAIPAGVRFDDKSLLLDKTLNPNDLIQEGTRFWTQPKTINLDPGQYKFFKFAKVTYMINIGASGKDVGLDFSLVEPLGAAGLSMKWNDKEIERIPSIVRESTGLKYIINFPRYFGKAAIPGHTYGPYGTFINNLGDPRISHYMTTYPLGENSFPENISPNRRNIRWESIYKLDSPSKTKIYGRVIPSEWADGGHDCQVTTWTSGWSTAREKSGPSFDPTTVGGEAAPQEGESITYLSDRKRYYSATELGRLYDPIMWLPTFDPKSKLDSTSLRGDGSPTFTSGIMPGAGLSWPLVQVGNQSSQRFGGGNTLRIGRPEHPKFNLSAAGSVDHLPAEMPATHAARLLDLFHAGKSRSEDASLREGPLVRIEGHVNINTASRDALRSMAAGLLVMDPKLSKRTSTSFDGRMAPTIAPLSTLSTPSTTKEADIIADAIIKERPYASPSELACARDPDGKEVFGNSDLYPEKQNIQWSDAAAEEVFGRVYESSTVRSRNFRVWVVGQAVAPTDVTNAKPEVLSEVRRAYTVFADPGKRANDGKIETANYRTKIINENDF